MFWREHKKAAIAILRQLLQKLNLQCIKDLLRKTNVANACITFIGINTNIGHKTPKTTYMYHIFIKGRKRKMVEREPDLLTRRQA